MIILNQNVQSGVVKLLELYKEDKAAARQYFLLTDTYTRQESLTVAFKNETSIRIERRIKTYGISKTKKIYNSTKVETVLFLKKNKNYIKKDSKLRVLTLRDVFVLSLVYRDCMIEFYPWLRNFENFNNRFSDTVSLNYIQRHKCFNEIDLLHKKFNKPRPIAKALSSLLTFKEWQSYKDNIICNDANSDLFPKLDITNRYRAASDNFLHIFKDSLRLAKTLDRTVNTSWSEKRMTAEHDEMSKIVTNLKAEMNNRELRINPIFHKFELFTRYPMLKTTKELALEGEEKKHCVASYDRAVDAGHTAIYHFDKYTLEMRLDKNKLRMGQFLGLRNQVKPSDEEMKEVQDKIDNFNRIYAKELGKPEIKLPYLEEDLLEAVEY